MTLMHPEPMSYTSKAAEVLKKPSVNQILWSIKRILEKQFARH